MFGGLTTIDIQLAGTWCFAVQQETEEMFLMLITDVIAGNINIAAHVFTVENRGIERKSKKRVQLRLDFRNSNHGLVWFAFDA